MAQEQEQISKGEADAASVQPSVKRNLFATTLAEVDRANVSWMSLSVSVRASGSKQLKAGSDGGGASASSRVRLLDNISGSVAAGKTTLLDTLAGRTPRSLEVAGDIHVNGRPSQMSYGTVAYVPQEDLLTGSLTVRETVTFTANLRLTLPAAERAQLVDELLRSVGLLGAASTMVGTALIKGISGGQRRRLSVACEMLVRPSIIFLDEPTSGLDSASAFFCVGSIRAMAQQGRTVTMSIHQPSAEVFGLFDKLLLLSKGRMIYCGDAAAAGQFYADAGVPCPPHRAPADHFVFSMNTDFDAAADEFASAADLLQLAPPSEDDGRGSRSGRNGVNGSSGEEDGEDEFENFLPGLPAAPEPAAAGAAPVAAAAAGAGGSNSLPIHAKDAIERLQTHFEATARAAVEAQAAGYTAAPGPAYAGIRNAVSPARQFAVLVHRMVLINVRDVGVFWIRLAMYLTLCVCLGTVYFQLGNGWNEVVGRVGLLIFTTCFLTFMAVSGFPTFVEEMQVFTRERLNGYYGVLPYTIANTVASFPFLLSIALACTMLIRLLADLNVSGDRFPFAVLNLTLSLTTSEAIVMAVAAVVPHPLPGIAAAAAIMGIFMPVGGYLIPLDILPDPFWRYPMHYLSLYSYSLNAAVLNEFEGTGGWACPCTLQDGGCGAGEANCELTGEEVIKALGFNLDRSKWVDMVVLLTMLVAYRAAFFALLKLREARCT